MSKGPIRLDASSTGVVIVCALCPWWAAFRFTKTTAWECACDHEARVHPGEYHQRKAAHDRERQATRR